MQKLFDDYPDQREGIVRQLLFMGSMTGRLLLGAFGASVDDIIWEESTKELSDSPDYVPAPDLPHMLAVLVKHEPQIVLTFGHIACEALWKLDECYKWPNQMFHIPGPHPAARRRDVMEQLQMMADRYYAYLTLTTERVHAFGQTKD